MTATKKLSDKEQAFLDEEVEFEFYNIEEPGVSHEFDYGPSNNIKHYVLHHGQRYRYPRKIVNHIETKGPSQWEMTPDGQGRMQKRKIGMSPRFQCRVVYSMG